MPDLNKLLPHFEINNELRISAFLATCCIESDYWKATSEYGKGKGRAYAKVYKDTGKAYYGRGIIQNTWRDAYENFTAYVKRNWSWLQPMAGVKDAPNFVTDPDLLTEPFWAVLGACWFWHRNALNKRADGGLKSFFAIQGIVNRGTPTKQALHYADRLAIYETLRRTIPDNFSIELKKLTSTDKPPRPIGNPSAITPNGETVDNQPDSLPSGLYVGKDKQNEQEADAGSAANSGASIGEPSNDGKNTAQIMPAPPDAPDNQQIAETIVNTGDNNVPDGFVSEDKRILAPEKDNATATATKATILGFAVPPTIYAVFQGITNTLEKGYFDAKEIIAKLMDFLIQNMKYVFILVGLIIVILIVKKIFKQLAFLLQMYLLSRPDLHTPVIIANQTTARSEITTWQFIKRKAGWK